MDNINKSILNIEKSIKLLDNIKNKVKENRPIKIEFKPVIKVDVQYEAPPKKKTGPKKKPGPKKKKKVVVKKKYFGIF